jgi:hypothetical protein
MSCFWNELLPGSLTSFSRRFQVDWSDHNGFKTYGTIAWHYEIIGGNKYELSFKRITIRSTDTQPTFGVEKSPDREQYAKEILVKRDG